MVARRRRVEEAGAEAPEAQGAQPASSDSPVVDALARAAEAGKKRLGRKWIPDSDRRAARVSAGPAETDAVVHDLGTADQVQPEGPQARREARREEQERRVAEARAAEQARLAKTQERQEQRLAAARAAQEARRKRALARQERRAAKARLKEHARLAKAFEAERVAGHADHNGAEPVPERAQEEHAAPVVASEPAVAAPVSAHEPEPMHEPEPAVARSATERAERLLEDAATVAAVAPVIAELAAVPVAAREPEAVTAGGPARPARRRFTTSTQAAAAVILLLAAGVGVLLYEAATPAATKGTAARTLAPPTTVSHAGERSSAPVLSPRTSPPSTTTVTTAPAPAAVAPPPKPVTAALHGAAAGSTPTTTTVPLQPCTPGDLSIVTTTDQTSYAPGQTIVMTTKVTDVTACIFTPAPVGAYSCPASVAAMGADGSQAYPAPSQAEQCSPPPGGTLEPGATRTLTATWNGEVFRNGSWQSAPPGSYSAVGTWGWSAGSGQPPYSVSARSAPFTLT